MRHARRAGTRALRGNSPGYTSSGLPDASGGRRDILRIRSLLAHRRDSTAGKASATSVDGRLHFSPHHISVFDKAKASGRQNPLRLRYRIPNRLFLYKHRGQRRCRRSAISNKRRLFYVTFRRGVWTSDLLSR